ncbi:hypothetical protein B0H10DRAFT_2235457 [Mycena sp. CBHHK59/15]|nr:hypothetical protein B0H10DRAFT_2235457 [Mycena sp. CBHHK59/15]
MAVDLLRNRNPAATLGPFDGKVAALAHIAAEHYFITTNADYVPDVPSLKLPHAVFLRSDMRYGTDDPTLWPQQWTARYCHLPVIAKKGTRPDLDVMWWDPSPADFRVRSAVTRGLGRLHWTAMSRFTPVINELVTKCKDLRRTSATPISPLFGELVQNILMWAEQLRTLPTTYDKIVFGVTSLQRGCLELDALYNYMTIYKPRVDNFMTALPGMIPVARTVGAFTTVPAVAQQLWSACLPFWLLRPTFVFDSENILAVVPLQQPNFVVADTPGAAAPPVLYSGNQTLDKIATIHRAAIETPWYRDPFETNTSPAPPAPAPPAPRPTASIPIASSPVASSSHGVARAKKQPSRLSRAKPYPEKAPAKGPPKIQRDKFTTVTLEEMAPSIVAWADALAQVDQSIPPLTSDPVDRQYVLPEPALFVTTSSERRRKFLHHWNLLSDGFIYRLSQPGHSQPLSAQEWRDILEGLITKRGNPNSKTYRRSEKIEDRIRPALKASSMSSVEGLPVPLESLPEFTVEEIRENVWLVAEINFRFEFCSLDRRASKMDRLKDVKACFAGHTLLGVPLEMSKRGWASTAVEERHCYVGRTATLMLDWRTQTRRPTIIGDIAHRSQWSPSDMQHLEKRPKLAPDGHPTTERARLHVSQASGLDSMSASPDFHVEQAMYSTFGGARRMPDDSRTASSPTLTMDGHTERARLHVAQPTLPVILLPPLLLASMKRLRKKNEKREDTVNAAGTSLLATGLPSYKITYHTATPKTEQRYARNAPGAPLPQLVFPEIPAAMDTPFLPFLDVTEEEPGAVPSYETTVPCDEDPKTRQNVAHMNELKEQEPIFIQTMLSLYHHSLVLTPCACGQRARKVACHDCLQAEVLCPQCWLNKHRTMPTHWGLVWNAKDGFFEKYDFCRVMKNAVIGLGHQGERCPDADPGRSFTLVESNGIHATAIAFCRCKGSDGTRGAPEFQQLLQAGIFPGSIKDPKTGYTLGLLEYYREQRSQGKGSAYNFVRVLQRMADPFFAGSVPDIYVNFLAITRFHEHLGIVMRRGHAHRVDEPLPGEVDRPYPNRPIGYMGLQCGACPERGVNMPLVVHVPKYLRHCIAQHQTIDGNFKANLFFKRDDGSDIALTDGRMYFPKQAEFERIAKTYVVPEEDKEVPCKAHIGSIRHQGQVKYGNTAVSGVVACACDHAIAGSFVDMIKGEAFALGTYAQREHFRHTNSPPHTPESASPHVCSYDSYCSFMVNRVKRAIDLFPEEIWLHTLLAQMEGQIPADHINGHGLDCQSFWQAAYFACRAHFHGETAEMLWAFLNPLGSSTRQMTGAAWHDIINFVMDAWNTWKLLRQAELLAEERLDALRLFELHMAVVEDLSKQHATQVVAWSQQSRTTTKSAAGKPESVYQHKSTEVLTIESMLASLIAAERERSKRDGGNEGRPLVAEWLHNGLDIERQQVLVIALVESHRQHPLQDTWATITKLRDSLNVNLKKFRECQREIYPRLTLSALDVDEPELTAVQLPSYRMKHGQCKATDVDVNNQHSELREAEIQLRCGEANGGILAVRVASLALSAVKKARDLDYRGQAGITRTARNLQKAELMKTFEITVYNRARAALIHLGHMKKDAVEPYPPLTHRDTRRKETHLHRAKGDSRLFDGTAWYLQSGVTLSSAAVGSTLSPLERGKESEDDEPEPRLLAGTQTLKRSGFKISQRPPKRLRDIAPDDVVVVSASSSSEAEDSDVEMSPTRKQGKQRAGKQRQGKKKKSDGWIWLENMTRGQTLGEGRLAEYKEESDRVQWFRAEAEMYRWLEQYERKHAELMRVIERFRRDSEVWVGLGDRAEQQNGGINGVVSFARMQAAMYKRLEHNARVVFKSADSGAHHDWVSATTIDELVKKIDGWRDVVFRWMDEMGIHRAYKDF